MEKVTTGPGPQAKRADAVRNRSRILEAARHLITNRGPGVGMSEISRAAGVAVGTLYRHFPTKTDLVAAVVIEYVESLAQAAEDAWGRVEADRTDAGEELLDFVSHALEMTARNHAAKAAARTLGAEPEYSDAELRAAGALELLLDAGRKSGKLRSDLTVSDVYLLVAFCPTDCPTETLERWLALIRPALLHSGEKPPTPDAKGQPASPPSSQSRNTTLSSGSEPEGSPGRLRRRDTRADAPL